MARFDVFARSAAGTPQEGASDPEAMDAQGFATAAWPHLRKASEHRHAFVAETALVGLARAAATDAQRVEARQRLLAGLSHRNHLIARCCAVGLGDVHDAAALERMAEVARDPKGYEDVRAFLALALADAQAPQAPALLQAFATTWHERGARQEMAAAAFVALGSLRGASAQAAAAFLRKQAFGKKGVPSQLRAFAIGSLGRLGAQVPVFDALLDACTDADPRVRRAAVIALGRSTEVAGVPDDEPLRTARDAARARLLEVLGADDDPFNRRLAAVALGRLTVDGAAEALQALRATWAQGGPGLREFALLGLALAGDGATVGLVEEALASDVPSTRSAGCVALGVVALRGRGMPWLDATRRASIDTRLRGVLTDDPHPFVRAYAAVALGMVGEAAGTAALEGHLDGDRTPEEIANVLMGLGLAGRRGAASVILRYLRPDMARNGFIASHAICALGLTKARTKAVAGALGRLADDGSDQYVAAAALNALGQLARDQGVSSRHQLAAAYDYTINYDYVSTWVLMI